MAPDSITAHDAPANGVVVVDVGCAFGNCFEGELPEELPVMDKTAGELVPGAIVYTTGSIDSQARIVWKPDAPLVAGNTYEVMWQPAATQAFAELDYELLALPAATWTANDIVVTASTWLNEASKEWVECEVSSGDLLCGPNDAATYTVQNGLDTSQRVGLQAAIDAEASPAGADGQYVVKAALWGEGEEQPELIELPGHLYASISINEAFETAFDAYCYRIEVTSLVDDTVAVTQDCLPHTYGTLTTTPLSDAQIASQLGWCIAPPAGYEDLWCTGRRARCEEAMSNQWDEPGCDTLEDLCSDPMVPNDDPMVPNDDPSDPNDDPSDPNDDPVDPSDPSDDDDDVEDDDEMMMKAEPGLEGGCSATSDHRGRAWPGLLFATIFLAVRMRRARKSA